MSGRSSVFQTWHKECLSQKKQNDTCCAVAMKTATGRVLIKLTTIPSFCPNQGPSTPANLMMRVETMLTTVRLNMSVPNLKVENDIWFLIERDWSQESFHD